MIAEAKETRRFWWVPLAGRMLRWSLTMMLLWGWFPFLFGGDLAIYILLNPDFIKEPAGQEGSIAALFLRLLFLFPLVVTVSWMLGGAIAGALAGFYAPVSEPKNPFQSTFFRTVGKQTFWVWFFSTLGVGFSLSLLGLIGSYIRVDVQPPYIYPLSVIGLFVLSLWRALNRALIQQRQAPSLHER